MLSENIQTIRKQRGMSQEMLAQRLNVVRQTISKWEKGLSVPDAEMLARIAELYEMPVSELLGEKLEAESNTNEVAVQLAILNEQLAGKSSRNKKIIKGILITAAAIAAAYVAISAAAFFMYSLKTINNTTTRTLTCTLDDNTTTTTLTCTLDGEEYIYRITYDEQYKIIEAGGNAFIANHIETEKYSDAGILIAQIEDYFIEHGGTCEY